MDTPTNDDLQEFIDSFDETLRGFVRSMQSSDRDVDDIVQDVWYGFVRSLSRGAIIENPEAWLYRSARNRIIDAYRKIKPSLDAEDVLEELVTDSSPEAHFDEDEFFNMLEIALDELPENQRHVFLRNEVEGITLREIADEEGENLKTIISRKRYAVIKLRASLGDYYENYWAD